MMDWNVPTLPKALQAESCQESHGYIMEMVNSVTINNHKKQHHDCRLPRIFGKPNKCILYVH